MGLLQQFKKKYNLFKKNLENSKKILISTHQLSDGDGLGSEIALYHYLRKSKKECFVCNPDPLPHRYQFLDPEKKVLLDRLERGTPELFDLWIILDTNDPRRLGWLWDQYSHCSKAIFFLDHHVPLDSSAISQVFFPDHAVLVSDLALSSIGELLYFLFKELAWAELNQDIAMGLYVSVMTDTNSFRYATTTPFAHQIASDMIKRGLNPEKIYQSIYSSKELSHLHLLGEVLQKAQLSQNGKIAWLQMDLRLRESYRASSDDTLFFLNLLLLIQNVEIICFFREEKDELNQWVRVSIRSRGNVSIQGVAAQLGGGGHEYAAGAAIRLPIDQAIKNVIELLTQLFSS